MQYEEWKPLMTSGNPLAEPPPLDGEKVQENAGKIALHVWNHAIQRLSSSVDDTNGDLATVPLSRKQDALVN